MMVLEVGTYTLIVGKQPPSFALKVSTEPDQRPLAT